MILVKITMNVLPEKRLEVMQTLISMIEPTEKEEGCLGYGAFRDMEEDSRLCLLEEWKTREDLDRHIRTWRFGVLLGIKTLLREPPEIQIYTVTSSEGIETIVAARSKEREGLQRRRAMWDTAKT